MSLSPTVVSIARATVMGVALACAVIGTAGSLYKYDKAGTTAQLFFYETVVERGGSKTVTKAEKPSGCTDVWDRSRAAYAFAILSCIVAGAAVGLTVAEIFVARIPRVASVAAAGAFAVTSLVSWAISVAILNGKFCDQSKSFADSDYTLDYGVALMIVGWILSLVATAAGVLFGFVLNKAAPAAKTPAATAPFA